MAAERIFNFNEIISHAYVPVTEDNLFYAPELISVINGNGKSYANQVLSRISKKDFDSSKIIERQINGRKTKLISFADAILLIMVIPGRTATQARIKFADIIRRYLGGDHSLLVEINANAQSDDPIAQMARVSLASDEPSHEESRLILKRKCEELDLHVRKEVRDAEFEFIANAASCLAAIRNHEELDDEEKQALRARCLRSVKRD
jgi:hypothetical protein